MIKIDHATKNYGSFELDLEELNIPEGVITGLVGTNGSGKTTTFRLLGGLIRPDSGSVSVMDQNAWTLSPSAKERIGFVFSDSSPEGIFTIDDVKKMQAAFYSRFDSALFDSLCRQLELPGGKRISQFSTGMKAKLNIVCALSHQPQLLVLDEPTAGLDVIARQQIHELLQSFMETPGRSIIISSHIASDLETICDDFWMIHNGKLMLHEDVDTLLDGYGILTLSDAQEKNLDPAAAVARLRTPGGWKVLVSDRAFYEENDPDAIVEKGNLDDLIVILEKGERI